MTDLKYVGAIAIAASGLFLGGCAAGTTPDRAYLETLREAEPSLADVPDQDLIDLGEQVCEMFDTQGFEAGMTELVRISEESGISSTGAGTISGAAVGAYCPEYWDEF